jgi:hypothetical protein
MHPRLRVYTWKRGNNSQGTRAHVRVESADLEASVSVGQESWIVVVDSLGGDQCLGQAQSRDDARRISVASYD